MSNTPTFQNNNNNNDDDDDDNDNCDDAASTVLGKVTQSYLKTINLYVPHFEKISLVPVFRVEGNHKCEHLYTATLNQSTQVNFS